MARDRDIRQDIRDRLEATNEFDAVLLSDAPEDGPAAGGSRVAVVGPFAGDAHDQGDVGPGGPLLVSERCSISIIARDEDPATRDAIASKLLGIVANTLAGVSLGGVTFLRMNPVQSWKWKPAEPPERILEVVIKYEYELGGWGTFDTTE